MDFSVLQDIYAEMKRKSGEKGEFSIIQGEGIVIEKGSQRGPGNYEVEENSIHLYYKDKDEPPYKSVAELRNIIFSTLVHEETHGASKNAHSNFQGDFIDWLKSYWAKKPADVRTAGFERDEYHQGHERKNFIFFNEGLTELISEQVYAEYFKRAGDRAFFSESGQDATFMRSYPGGRALVRIFIEIIASQTGVSSEVVQNSILQGAMSGLDLRETSLQKAFDDIFFPAFVEEINNRFAHETELPIHKLFERAKDIHLSPDQKQEIELAYAHFVRYLQWYDEQEG